MLESLPLKGIDLGLQFLHSQGRHEHLMREFGQVYAPQFSVPGIGVVGQGAVIDRSQGGRILSEIADRLSHFLQRFDGGVQFLLRRRQVKLRLPQVQHGLPVLLGFFPVRHASDSTPKERS